MDRKLLLAAFFSLFFSILLFYLPHSQFSGFLELAAGAVFVIIVALALGFQGALVSTIIIAAGALLQPLLPYTIVFELHLGLVALALIFVQKELGNWIVKKISGAKELFWTAVHGAGLFIGIVAMLLAFGLTLILIGIKPDTVNVYDKVVQFPFYVMVFAVLLAPVSEELFFRGFLAGRFGVLPAAAIFALSHFTYGSFYEIGGTFLIGLALSSYFVKSKNLAACMVAHGLFNLFSLTIMSVSRQFGVGA